MMFPRHGRFALAIYLPICLSILCVLTGVSRAQIPSLGFGFKPNEGEVGCAEILTVSLEVDASIRDLNSYSLVLDFDNRFFQPRAVLAGPLVSDAGCMHKVDWFNEGEDADSIVVDVTLWGCSISGPGEILVIEFEDAGARGMSSLDLRSGVLRDTNKEPLPFSKSTAMMVNQCNHSANAEDDAFELIQGGVLTESGQGLLANDDDPDGDLIHVNTTPAKLPRHGDLTLYPLGAFDYTHDDSKHLSDSFVYEVNDRYGGKSTATVKLTILPKNGAPIAVDDEYIIIEGGSLGEQAPGLLTNDSDPENDPLTVSPLPVHGPRHGRLVLDAGGSFEYFHDGGEAKVDSFTYEAIDDVGGVRTGLVVLTVAAQNDAPILVSLNNQISTENEFVSVQMESSNDEEGELRFRADGLPRGLSIDKTSGLISGRVECGAAAAGPYTVTLTVEDKGGERATSLFVWTVEPLPPPAPIDDLRTSQMRTGVDGDGTVKILLDWTGVPAGQSVEVFRKGWGGYPGYDKPDGAKPSAPRSIEEAVSQGWMKVSCFTDPCKSDEPVMRDFWYYVTFVTDPCGRVSAASNMTRGIFNYQLGDVAPSGGDNVVEYQDVSALGACYGSTTADDKYNRHCDVGPRMDQGTDGRPVPDGAIQFEDLMVFALNHDSQDQSFAPPLPAGADKLTLYIVDDLPTAGDFEVLIWMEGAGRIQGLSVPLIWNSDVLEFTGFESGSLPESQGGFAPALSPKPGTIDVALFGQRNAGISGKGLLGTVKFKVRGKGATALGFGSVLARDADNSPVSIAAGVETGMPEIAGIPVKSVIYESESDPSDTSPRIDFGIAHDGPVIIKVYDTDGQLVRSLLKEALKAGHHFVRWDRKNHSGNRAPSGSYVIQMQAPDRTQTRRITLR